MTNKPENSADGQRDEEITGEDHSEKLKGPRAAAYSVLRGNKTEILSGNNIEEAIRLLSGTFPDEPMNRILGTTPESFAHFARCLCEQSVGLSVVIRDNRGEVVGASVCEDLAKPSQINEAYKSHFIDKLLKELWKPGIGKEVIPGECLNICLAGSVKKGIGTRVCMATLDLAKKLGYKYVTSELTGPASQRIGEKLGFETIHQVVYSDFECEGQKPFKELEGSCNLAMIEL